MALIDLQFEPEEEKAPETPAEALPIALEFEGQGDQPTPQAGVTGEMRPVEQSLPESIRDWFMEGYTKTRQGIAQQKGLMFDESMGERMRTGARVEELEREAERYGPEREIMQKMAQLNEVDSISEGMGYLLSNPDVLGYLTVNSAGRFAPALAATIGVGAAGPAGLGAGAGMMAGGAVPTAVSPIALSVMSQGMGSLFIEYSATVDETMREVGLDTSDPASWNRFATDEDLQARAQKRGLVRGIPIAVMDGFSMGLSGRFLAGAKPTATSILTRSGAEVGQQMGTGGAGEYLAQRGEMLIGEREKTSPGEIAAEMAAELGPGAFETAVGYRSEKAEALRRQAAEQAGADAAQRVGDAALTPDFEVKSLEENETAIDEAMAAAPPTPEVRPDEESITEKFDLDQEVAQPQPELDMEQLQAEEEANAFVVERVRQQFPDATEEEILALVETYKPPREELPSEQDLGWVAPEEAPTPEPTPTGITPPPPQSGRAFPGEDAAAPSEVEQQTRPTVEWAPDEITAQPDEITRDEVVQATEPVESTGDAITTAETFRTARPEFQGLILSYRPGDQRGDAPMDHYYGELAETEDADGMPIDVMLNKDYDVEADTPIYIINQLDEDGETFLQHKVMAGFDEMALAEQAFMDRWGEDTWGSTYELTPEQFQDWVSSGDTKAPYMELKAAAERTPEVIQGGFRVAARTDQGDILDEVDGKPVQVHAHLLQGDNMEVIGDQGVEMGFVDEQGRFYTREEAIAQLDAEPDTTEVVETQTPVEPTQTTEPAAADITAVSPEDFDAMLEEAAPTEERAPAEPAPEETEQERRDQVEADRRERGRQQAERARQVSETDDLITFLRKMGGVNVENQSDIPATAFEGLGEERVVGLPGLTQRGDAGMTVSLAAELAWQYGYIPDNDISQLSDKIDDAKVGPVYNQAGLDEQMRLQQEEEYQRQAEAEIPQHPEDMPSRFGTDTLPDGTEYDLSKTAETQIATTTPTYTKVRDRYFPLLEDADILDYGAGKGLAAQKYGFTSLEPYPRGWTPDYTHTDQIKRRFDGIILNNILNVLPKHTRRLVLWDAAEMLEPGATMYINVRSRSDVNKTAQIAKRFNESEILTSRGTYQKGFQPAELVKFIQDELGPDYRVEKSDIGTVGVTVTKIDPRQSEIEAQEWAEHVGKTEEFSQVDPETARLMKLAGDIDYDAMVDISSKEAPEAEIQAALQAFIDERKAQAAETARAEPAAAETGRADEAEPAPALIPEKDPDVAIVEAAIERWERTPEGQEAIRKSKQEAAERERAYRAQRENTFGPEWAREEQKLFEYKPLDENNPQFKALSPEGQTEVRRIKAEMAEVYEQDPASDYLQVLQYELEKVVMDELAPPTDFEETGIAAIDAPDEHLKEIESYLAEGESNATLIPAINNDQGVDAPASIMVYEKALRAAGWTPFMRGRAEFWTKRDAEIFLSSQGNLAAPIIQYQAFEQRSLTNVLSDAMYPDPTSKPLNEISISFTDGDTTVTHKAEWWVEAIDKRLEKANNIRGCA